MSSPRGLSERKETWEELEAVDVTCIRDSCKRGDLGDNRAPRTHSRGKEEVTAKGQWGPQMGKEEPQGWGLCCLHPYTELAGPLRRAGGGAGGQGLSATCGGVKGRWGTLRNLTQQGHPVSRESILDSTVVSPPPPPTCGFDSCGFS